MEFTRRGRLAIALALSLAYVLPVLALASGRIEGRLTRRDGRGLPGVAVSISGTGKSTLTDAEGRYAFNDVPDGLVSVTFTSGANMLTVPDIRVEGASVTVDRTVDWDVGYVETLTVYSASRSTERFFDAPASVAVVTEDAIAQEAASAQLPRVLAAIPGVELAQSGVFDFNVNIRGLNAALTRRVLTLIDGRDPSSVLIGAQEWAAFGLPLDEVARVEVVRGPGSALYGTNAFNGVVDITTKQPRDSQGGNAELTLGGLGTARVSARHAGAVTPNSFYRAYGSFGRTDDFYQSRVGAAEYPGLPFEVLPLQRDHTTFGAAGARLDTYAASGAVISTEGGWAHTAGGVLLTGAGRIQNTSVERPWARVMGQTAHWRVAGSYDGRYGDMMSLTAGGPIVDRSMRLAADVSHRFDYAAGAGKVVLGAAYRFERADTRGDDGRFTLLRGVQRAHAESLFGQVDHPLADRLKLVVAARVDDSTLHDVEVSPKAALVYALTPTHTLRASYGHAFETGSFVHYYTQTAAAPPVSLAAVEAALGPALGGVPLGFGSIPVLALGNDRLQVERVNGFEAGYSGVLGRRLLVVGNYYFNRITNLITPLLPQVGTELGRINPAFGPYQPPSVLNATQQGLVLGTLGASLPPTLFATMSNDVDGSPIFAVASYTNFARVNLQGTELSVQYFAGKRITADAGYSGLKFTPLQRLSDPVVSANAPSHKVTAGVTFDSGPLAAGVRYRWADSFFWNGGLFRGQVPDAQVVDLTARYKVRPRTVVSVNVANLMDDSHYEIFGGDLLRRRALVTMSQSW